MNTVKHWFKRVFNYFRHRHDVALLTAAFLLLVIALFNPSIPLKRNIYSYMLVADISQSMNVEDATLNGKTVSRAEHMKYMMKRVVASMPCGTSVSVALFAGVSVAALYRPIEVCENYDAIQDTIAHLDWRTAWSGNSRIRNSMPNLARTLRSFPQSAQVVFFTDGEEAPKLHAFNTQDLTNFQGGNDWLFVGIGSDKGTPVPKLDSENQVIGYWSNESFAMQPGIAQISEANIGVRDDNVAGGETDRYLSKLDEQYLKDLAKEVNGLYVNGNSLQDILSAMKQQRPARRDTADYGLRWILASIAGLLFITAYLPKHPLRASREAFQAWRSRRRMTQAPAASTLEA